MSGVAYNSEQKLRSFIHRSAFSYSFSYEYSGVAYISEEILLPFVCMRVLKAQHHGRARRRGRCQRVLTGRGGVGRMAVASLMVGRLVFLETRENRERAVFIYTNVNEVESLVITRWDRICSTCKTFVRWKTRDFSETHGLGLGLTVLKNNYLKLLFFYLSLQTTHDNTNEYRLHRQTCPGRQSVPPADLNK